MNRIVIVAAAFVAGLGGTTAVFAIRAKPAPLAVAADSLPRADSAKADSSARHAADSSAAAPTATVRPTASLAPRSCSPMTNTRNAILIGQPPKPSQADT